MVQLTKMRWRIERDYLELKQELGLGRYERHGWRGFHRHATLCIAVQTTTNKSEFMTLADAVGLRASWGYASRVVPGQAAAPAVISWQTSTHCAAVSSARRRGAMRMALLVEPAAGTTSSKGASDRSQ
jgi:hypothetical protein